MGSLIDGGSLTRALDERTFFILKCLQRTLTNISNNMAWLVVIYILNVTRKQGLIIKQNDRNTTRDQSNG